MQEVISREARLEQAETDSDSVAQALRSDDPDIRARGFNAALRLLFRLNELTQKRQTQEQLEREIALIRLPVEEAMQSDDPWIRSRAGGVMNGLLGTLHAVTRKKQRVEQMIEQLREDSRMARRARRGQIIRASVLLVFAVTLFYTQLADVIYYWWLAFPLSGFWAVDRSRGHAVVQRLSEAWDPRAVGVLAVVAQERDAALKHQARQALTNLLPRVKASDAAYIDAEGMSALVALLEEVDDDPLVLALLQALEQVGDESAIPGVLALHDSPHVHPKIRQAAAECLPALENRAHLARESATLLRASSGLNPAEAAALLLRPASGTTASTDNLLRPAENRSAMPSIQGETDDPPLFFVKLPSEAVSGDTTLPSGTSLS